MIFSTANILLPQGIDLTKWAVIACDQYSSERNYWERVNALVGDAPSALRMIVPEAYLDHPEIEEYTLGVGKTAQEYIDRGVFAEYSDCFIYTQRKLRDGRVRHGLIGALDLDSYDYTGAERPIRATEETVPDRLPPRSKARLGSPLEMPHIMALINDESGIIEHIDTAALQKLYDFELMENSGRLTGYLVEGEAALKLAHELSDMPDGIMIGDGNHSLAAAKLAWEAIRRTVPKNAHDSHPARFALTELCSVFDPAIDFHAISRVVFGTEPTGFIEGLKNAVSGNGKYRLKLVSQGHAEEISALDAPIGEIIAAVQDYIDAQCEKTGCTVDYIHGEDSFYELSNASDRVGILLPPMDKADLFLTVKSRGVFPRKSFSIGEAWDKRFYMECRKIK